MAVPWLAVGKLVLTNLDTIIGVVKPAFTRKKVEALPSQTDLLNQQISELQAAASGNAEQIRQLAAQLKEVVAALEQAARSAESERQKLAKTVPRRYGDLGHINHRRPCVDHSAMTFSSNAWERTSWQTTQRGLVGAGFKRGR